MRVGDDLSLRLHSAKCILVVLARLRNHGFSLRCIGAHQNVAAQELPLAAAADDVVDAAGSDATLGLSKCRGRKHALAIRVGTTALATTAATRAEYCARVMTPCERANNAEIVPKISPVDISPVDISSVP